MASERQIDANRRNARNSTGPRSVAGKKRTSANAYRHGLAAALVHTQKLTSAIDGFALELLADAGGNGPIALAFARAAAEASLDLARVRQAKLALISGNLDKPRNAPSTNDVDTRSDRLKPTKQSEPAVPLPKQKPEREADGVRLALPGLLALDLYERRALARWTGAIIMLKHVAAPKSG